MEKTPQKLSKVIHFYHVNYCILQSHGNNSPLLLMCSRDILAHGPFRVVHGFELGQNIFFSSIKMTEG